MNDSSLQQQRTFSFSISTHMYSFDGEEIKEKGKAVTFGDIIAISLLTATQEDAKITREEKLARFAIVQKIKSSTVLGSQVELSEREIELILTCANRTLTIYTFGLLNQFLTKVL